MPLSWVISIRNIVHYQKKNIHETSKIEVSIDSNRNFPIQDFSWGLADDRDIYKNTKKLQNISVTLTNLI